MSQSAAVAATTAAAATWTRLRQRRAAARGWPQAERLDGHDHARHLGRHAPRDDDSRAAHARDQLLTALHAAGLLEREARADDRRRHDLRLSPAGHAALRSAEGLVRDQLTALLADVPPPEADALARLLPRVEAALTGSAPPRRPPPPRPHHAGPPPPPPRPRSR